MQDHRKGAPESLMHAACCASRYGRIIGRQDGRFPPMGDHVKDEMGGVWLHPIKILDGFYLQINGRTVDFTEYEIAPWGQVFRADAEGLRVCREDILTHTHRGAVITYRVANRAGTHVSLDAAFVARFHLAPVWFAEAQGIGDAPDIAEVTEDQTLVARDSAQPWFAAVRGQDGFTAGICPDTPSPDGHQADGVTATLERRITLAPNETVRLRFFIAGSHHSREEALMTLSMIRGHADRLIEERKEHARLVEHTARITTDREDLNVALSWVKQNTDWLVQTVDEIGTGLTAGLPEYAWWFGCDNAYALQGCLCAGMSGLCKETLLLLERISRRHNGNGRIVHEINTLGDVSNPGNTQETALFITAVRKVWDWTGDTAFLRQVYDACCMGIEWLLSQARPDCPIPLGYGIMEIAGLNVCLIDVAAYTCRALLDMYDLSVAVGEENKSYLERGEQLKKYIDERCWIEEDGQYCDCVATPGEVLGCLDNLRQRADEHSHCKEAYYAYLKKIEENLQNADDRKRPFLLAKNWVILAPIEADVADPAKAKRALASSWNDDFIGSWGAYLSASMKDHIMTISTGVRAVSETRVGRMDEAFKLLDMLTRTFERYMPGSISEMSPDYGCFTQAWTIYAAFVPVVRGFAGISADASDKTVRVCPNLPQQLNHVSIENLPVGDGSISVDILRVKDGYKTSVISSLNEWRLITP